MWPSWSDPPPVIPSYVPAVIALAISCLLYLTGADGSTLHKFI